MRVAVAGVPGAWSTEQLRLAFDEREVDTFSFDLAASVFDLNQGTVKLQDLDLGTLDGIVVKKLGSTTDRLTPPRVNLLRQLEHRGVRIFSPAEAINEVMDRYRMSQRLLQAGLPMPHTVVTEDLDACADVIEDWGRVVVKPLFTSKGQGMMLLASERAFRIRLRRWQHRCSMPFYIQKFVPHAGRDIGVAILDGQILGAYFRVGKRDSWITTTSEGGHYEPCMLDPEAERIALEAASLFGLDFTVVDLVESGNGYLLYEVSAFGGFSGLWQTHHVDAARLYAGYVIRTLAR